MLQISLQVTILFSNTELRGKDQTATAAMHYKAREREEKNLDFICTQNEHPQSVHFVWK